MFELANDFFSDMDLPDNIFDDFDFNNEENDEEIITSCNKVKIFFSFIYFPNFFHFETTR
jgi:hypothetical protein